MLKKLSQILLIIIFLIISFCVYLSVYGINTDKLNGIINEKISKRDKENENKQGSKKDIGWGHQIRSYVLHPYRLVKDNRTSHESSDPQKILDGDIDSFLENSLFKLDA